MSEDGMRPTDAGDPGPKELNCEESLARVYEYLDGELDVVDHDAVRRHLQKCRKCYPHFDFERLFLDYVHELGATEASNPGLAERVRAMIASDPS
ncbi:MAG: zf-HC2 domain-containing protein [marine benthic group bacterium]|jgi:mycothiol system anti-sigma-R factor|nr:zf-HC2 domain-containing protein [Candidatus Benthicola marisminoris]